MLRKNNKGFTLVEILAVIAILGVLSVLVVPRIFGLVTDSRKNIYVQDAKKLISQARYTMNAKSVKIEKPEDGECIVFSMKYLSVSDFQNPPNGGNYLTEGSFVVVKNVGGEFIYSAMIVEKTKDQDFMGIGLSTEDDLNEKGAVRLVQTFEPEEVGYVDETISNLNGGTVVNASFINDYIHKTTGENTDWIPDDDSIVGIYNNEEVEDKPLADSHAPKVAAKFGSGDGLLKTTLTVSATDADNAPSQLRVCVKVSRSASDSYPDYKNATDNSKYCSGYGNAGAYTKEIDFSLAEYGSFSYNQKETAYIYIAVNDPSGNVTRKRLTYDIHENEKPIISFFGIERGPNTVQNLPKASVYLTASDDMTGRDDLDICFMQDNDSATECTGGYKSYATYFRDKGYYEYTFKNDKGEEITVPDGSTHTLKVFVKDSSGLLTTAKATYSIYKNTAPVLSNGSLVPEKLFSGITNGNSLTSTLSFSCNDDLTSAARTRLVIEEVGTDNKIDTTVEEFFRGDQQYTFAGNYDGNDRQLKLTAYDEYNTKSNTLTVTATNIYQNLPPTISAFSVAATDNACGGANSCYDVNLNGGNYNVEVTLNVYDDLTKDDKDLLVCVSENPNDCKLANKATKFVHYSDFNRGLTLSHTGLDDDKMYPTEPITKTIYAAAIDSYGEITEYATPQTYKIYHNFAPEFDGYYSFYSTSTNGNLATVNFDFSNFNIIDDFNDYTVSFCYKVNGGNAMCTPYDSFTKIQDDLRSDYTFLDENSHAFSYNGQKITTYFKVKDNYGLTDTTDPVVEYNLMTDETPEIRSVSLESAAEGYNSNNVKVSFSVYDFQDTYKACISTTNSCANDKYFSNTDGHDFTGDNQEYTVNFDGAANAGWSSTYQEEENTKILYLFVKDSHGNVVSRQLSYELHKLCSNPEKVTKISEYPTYVHGESSAGLEITAYNCNGMCLKEYKTTELEHRNSLSGTNSIYGNYNKTISYRDTLVNLECNQTDEVTLYCNYVNCFDTGNTKNPNVISLKLYEEDLTWTYSNSQITTTIQASDPVCDNPPGPVLFNRDDSRCTKVNDQYTYCNNQATQYCALRLEDERVSVQAQNDAMDEERRNQIAALEAEKQEIIAQRIEEYNQQMEVYNHEVEVCNTRRQEEEEIYNTEYNNALTDFLNLHRAQYDEVANKCEALTHYTEEELDELTATCADVDFCDRVLYCYANKPDLTQNPDDPGPPDDPQPEDPGPEDDPQPDEDDPFHNIVCDPDAPYVNDPDNPFTPPSPTLNPEQIFITYFDDELAACQESNPEQSLRDACALLPYRTQCQNLQPFDEEGYTAEFHASYPPFAFVCEPEKPQYPSFDDLATYTDVPLPEYIVLDEDDFLNNCTPDAYQECDSFVASFCDKESIKRTYEVPCDSSDVTAGPYWCNPNSPTGKLCTNGYEPADCGENNPNCLQMCYREVDCASSTLERAQTFVCKGYFKAYQSVKNGGVMTLQDTGMRICPDFYRQHQDLFAYDSTSNTPYIKFNPDELWTGEE